MMCKLHLYFPPLISSIWHILLDWETLVLCNNPSCAYKLRPYCQISWHNGDCLSHTPSSISRQLDYNITRPCCILPCWHALGQYGWAQWQHLYYLPQLFFILLLKCCCISAGPRSIYLGCHKGLPFSIMSIYTMGFICPIFATILPSFSYSSTCTVCCRQAHCKQCRYSLILWQSMCCSCPWSSHKLLMIYYSIAKLAYNCLSIGRPNQYCKQPRHIGSCLYQMQFQILSKLATIIIMLLGTAPD